MKHSKLVALTLAFFAFVSFQVLADDLFDLDGGSAGPEDPTAPAEAAPAEEAEAPAGEAPQPADAPKTAQLDANAAAADSEAEAELRDLNIEKKKQIKVVQKKDFTKDGRFELGIDLGFVCGDWEDLLAVGIRAAYHFNEYIALQVRFLYGAVSWENETLKQAKEVDAYVAKSNMMLTGGASVVFTPFYGKLSVFGDFIPKYDINGSVGVYYYRTVAGGTDGAKKLNNNDVAFQVGFAPRIFLGKNASLSLNFDWFIMKDKRPKLDGGSSAYLKSDFLFTINASMFLPFAK
jgi:outer membrane beta-barrel protein